MHTLTEFCEHCANEIAGPAHEDGSEAKDLPELIEMIMQIVLTLIKLCKPSTPDVKIVAAVKKPNRVQRARFKTLAYDICQQCDSSCCRGNSAVIANCMIDCAAKLQDGEALSIVFEARNDDWMVV